jgi:FixJ family two-component response regulator
MPQMSGPDLAAHLGRLGYRGPVLFMSGYTDPADRRLAEPIEQGHFIAKPFAPRDLAERVLDILELSSGEPS